MEAKRIARQNTTHFTWVLNNTRGSALLATMLHTAVNVWTDIYRPTVPTPCSPSSGAA